MTETETRAASRDAPVDDFEAFVHATAPRLLRTAVLLCGDQHLAEDLLQTTYAKVWSHWRTVQRADHPVAYARTVLTRTLVSHRRRRSSTERPADLDERDLPGATDDRGDVGRAESRHDLMSALGRLSRNDRTVLVLRYWEDLSVAETAHVLGLNESTCRARAKRALTRLRAQLPALTEPDQS